ASNRSGNFGIYRQALGTDIADRLLAGPDQYIPTCISPDGRWLLFSVHAKRDRIMRMPIGGGPAEPVLAGHISGTWCARASSTLCAISERTENRKQIVFTAFDPVNGRKDELARLNIDPRADYVADLSPDGTRIAIVEHLGTPSITILSLFDGA